MTPKTLLKLFPLLISAFIGATSFAQLRATTISDLKKDGTITIAPVGSTGYFAWYTATGLGTNHTLNFYDQELKLVNSTDIRGEYFLSNYDTRENLLCICLSNPNMTGATDLHFHLYDGAGKELGNLTLERQVLTTLTMTNDGIYLQTYEPKTNKQFQRLFDDKFKEKWKQEEIKNSTQYYLQAETYPFLEPGEWLVGTNHYEHEKGMKYHYIFEIKSIDPATGTKNFSYTENTGMTYFTPLSIKKNEQGNYDVLGGYRLYKFPNTITPDESGIFKLVLNSNGEKMGMIQTKWSQFLSKVLAVAKDPDESEIKNIYKKTMYGTAVSATTYFLSSTIIEAMVWKDQYGFFVFGGNEFFMIYTDEDLHVTSVKNIRSNKNDVGESWIGFFTCGEDKFLPDQIVYLALTDKRHVKLFFVNPDPEDFGTSSFDKLVFEDKFDRILYDPLTHTSNIAIVHSYDCEKFLIVNTQVSASKDVRIYLYGK